MADIELNLLNCPFCGGVAGIAESMFPFGDKEYIAACRDCEAIIPHGWKAQDVAEQWNQRATPPSPSTAPEELKRLQLNHGLLEVSFEQVKARAQQADARILELEAALASRPAEVGDDPPQWWHELQAAAEALDDAGAPLNAESVRKIAEQYRQGQRDAVAADRARRGDINPEDAFVLYSAADVIDECGKVLVALKVRGIADRVIMPEITKAPR